MIGLIIDGIVISLMIVSLFIAIKSLNQKKKENKNE